VRLGLNYQIGDDAASSEKDPKPAAKTDSDRFDFHGQTTFTWQGYPAIRSPYQDRTACLEAARPVRSPISPSIRRTLVAGG